LTLAAVIAALVISRRADSEWAPAAVVGGGTVLGLALLGLTLAITTSATDADNESPRRTESVQGTPTPTASRSTEVATAQPTPTPTTETASATATPTSASTSTPTPTPTPSPTPAATEAVAGPPPTRYVDAEEGGVRWRSACAPEALLAGWWPNGTEVEVMRAGPANCEGWSLVRSGSLVSWVNQELLAETPPDPNATSTSIPAATSTPESSPTPPSLVSGQQGSYSASLYGWLSRLRGIEVALESNFDRAVSSGDWAAAATNATRLGTAAVAVRTEIEQTAPYVAELAPSCRDAMAPLGEMASVLVQMTSAYQEWLAEGLVNNDAGLRVSAQRDALDEAESNASTALEGCT